MTTATPEIFVSTPTEKIQVFCLFSELVKPDGPPPNPENPKKHPPEQIALYAEIVRHQGVRRSVVVSRRSGFIVSGHGFQLAAQLLKLDLMPVEYQDFASEAEEMAHLLADNQLATQAEMDLAATTGLLAKIQAALAEQGKPLSITGYTPGDFSALLSKLNAPGLAKSMAKAKLSERFGVPPFSVLDARQGYWQTRKAAWLDLGLQSEVGRGANALNMSASMAGITDAAEKAAWNAGRRTATHSPEAGTTEANQTSIFDPVLCELAFRWFCPPGGRIVDPFAGGSVRGVVAAMLGFRYVGVDLRPEQVAANREQAVAIVGASPAVTSEQVVSDPDALTPVERRGEYWLKRDDLLSIGDVRGGKVRSCWHLAQGATGLVTAGSRQSPQVNIVASIGKALGVPVRVHTPTGELSPEVQDAQRKGATVVQHAAGYNNVIIARAREDAAAAGWREIPFGMECAEAVKQTRRQVANLPSEVKRIVIPVGSGMSLCGVLWGLKDCGRDDVAVVGVRVGSDPAKRLAQYAPSDWQTRVTLVASSLDYHAPAPTDSLEGVLLDPIYEAKCLPFLQPGDCLWLVGIRATALPAPGGKPAPVWHVGDSRRLSEHVGSAPFDFIFSCPPYADLEVYSEHPGDLSLVCSKSGYAHFLSDYRAIIANAVALLAPDRFACFVVGDVRDKHGAYRNFVADTIAAFRDAGMTLYNDAVLVTPTGSTALRAAKPFETSRKLGKTHQNVLVFFKGNLEAVRAWPVPDFSLDGQAGQ